MTPATPPLGGVIEGFYGAPWSMGERETLFGWMGAWGLDVYLYAPKDDLKHRALWRVPYTESEAAALAALARRSAERGVRFVYALAPGLDVTYSAPEDREALFTKVSQVMDLGVQHVALLFDDIQGRLPEADAAHFASFAAAQAALTNALVGETRKRAPDGLFLFCPTEYCAAFVKGPVAESPYLRELGEALHPEILVMWTGPEVVSETITAGSVREVAGVLKRKPLVWDNLHANDYDRRRLYLGPYAGRPSELRGAVAGILSNPNNEFWANFVPLWTLARYLREEGYDPAAALSPALEAWLPAFASHGRPVTLDDLRRLVGAFDLPFGQTPWAQALVGDARTWLTTGERGAGERFKLEAKAVGDLLSKLAWLENRALFYALQPYLVNLHNDLWAFSGALSFRARHPGRAPRPGEGLSNTYALGVGDALRALLREVGAP